MKHTFMTLATLLAKEIHYTLESRGYLPGDKLPSERELAQIFDVQRATIREALNELIQEGVLYAEEKRGYFLARPRLVRQVDLFSEESALDVPRIRFRLQSRGPQTLDETTAASLFLPPGSRMHCIRRLCQEEGQTVALETYWIPEREAASLALTQAACLTPSLTAFIKEALAIQEAFSDQKVTLTYAAREEARLLEVEAGQPLLMHRGNAGDGLGRLFLHFEHVMRMERFSFYRKERTRDVF